MLKLKLSKELTCHSSLLIHSWWKVPKLARMLPPSHPPYRRSMGFPGAWILTCRWVSQHNASATRDERLTCWKCLPISAARRSAKPAKRLPPPVRTTLPKSTWRRSLSHCWIEDTISEGIVLGRFGFDACACTQHTDQRQQTPFHIAKGRNKTHHERG